MKCVQIGVFCTFLSPAYTVAYNDRVIKVFSAVDAEITYVIFLNFFKLLGGKVIESPPGGSVAKDAGN